MKSRSRKIIVVLAAILLGASILSIPVVQKWALFPFQIRSIFPAETASAGPLYEGTQRITVYETLAGPAVMTDHLPIACFDGQMFFTPAVTRHPELQEELRAILARRSTYLRFSGEKKCGGFHADFQMTLNPGPGEARVQICLTCGEAILLHHNSSLRTDLDPAAETSLREIWLQLRSEPAAEPEPEVPQDVTPTK